ncbi:unnamed protein product [Bursaphelenchus xylophilus]|uniref:(pine wood nematode) hypothetical protein n=1 Tax=Bursaphelenchus xylophilus TaxID=6326 RepID=A0A1I7S5Q3_BURXY|nr:unnamed protein product [Bursaphelenchus xylophilus]CAG9124958.1 unnamed protein product [Bursaphelenchus xylophilus]
MYNVTTELLAGGLGGSAGILIGYPMDTIKANVQTGNKLLWKDVKNNVRSLYRGMAVPLASAFFLNALMFAGYEGALRLMGHKNKDEVSTMEIVLASTVGTLAQLGPAIPIETVKTRLQVVYQNTVGPVRCIKDTLKTTGIQGLYSGGKVMAFRDLIGYSFYIPVYEEVKRLIEREIKTSEVNKQMLAGGIAGSLAWLAICPLEVVKNWAQCNQEMTNTEIITRIWQKNGILGFFKGGAILAARAFPANAVTFLVYEQTLKALKNE